MDRYDVRFEPSGNHWILSGPVGANGRLLFKSAREAASHARWAAKSLGGFLNVCDPEGNLFKEEEIPAGPQTEIAKILT